MLPSNPAAFVEADDLARLRDWWDYWKHILCNRYERFNSSSSLFLVISTLSAPQYALACEQNRTLDTRLQIVASSVVAQHGGRIHINGSLGCRISEVGTAFFHIGVFDLENPWVVYISELRAQIFGPMLGLKELFVRILRHMATCCRPRPPRQYPRSPLSQNLALENLTEVPGAPRETCVGTSFEITSSWSIIQTTTGEIYVEYHGDPCHLGFYNKNQSCSLPSSNVLTSDEDFVWKSLEVALRPILVDCPNPNLGAATSEFMYPGY